MFGALARALSVPPLPKAVDSQEDSGPMGDICADEFARFAVEPGWRFAIRHRVRWSECDPFRHANHRAHFEWFEEARNRYLESAGLPGLSAGTPGPVIAETGIRYHRPLAYGDEILVSARTVRLGNTSFEMEYAAWHQDCARRAARC
jgi:acyl-CoA thioester hydrolase